MRCDITGLVEGLIQIQSLLINFHGHAAMVESGDWS